MGNIAEACFLAILATFGCLLVGGGLGVAVYANLYYDQPVPDESIPTCTWVEDVLDNGCIHHRVFLLGGEKNVSTKIYPDCVLETPFHENVTYWCVHEEGATYTPHFSQPTRKKDASVGDKLVLAFIFGGIIEFFLLFAFLMTCSDLCDKFSQARKKKANQKKNPLPKQREAKRNAKRISRRAKKQRTPNGNSNVETEMPKWV